MVCPELLDPISPPVIANGRRFRPLRPISPDESRIFQEILAGEHLLQGIRNADLRRSLFLFTRLPDEEKALLCALRER